MSISSVASSAFTNIASLPQGVGSPATSPTSAPSTSFGGLVQKFLADANSQQIQADQAIQSLAMGKSDSIHETMLAMAKADLSFRMMMEVQGKVIDAYQEVMRMQV